MNNRRKAKDLCRRVVDEINDYELVNEREIREIIHRYRWLYKVVPYTPVDGPLGEFHKLYGALLKLSLYLNEKQNAIIATKEYAKIKNRSDKAIIEWLLHHEQLGRFLTKMYIDTFIADPEILNKGHDKLFAEFTLQVAVVDFYPLLDFIDIFTSHYSKVLEKYHNPEGDGIHYENDVEYYEAKETTLIDFIAPALKMPIEEVFKNHKEPFEVKRLKHLVPFKAYQRTSPSPQLQKAHDLFHQDQYSEAIELYQELLLTRTDLEEAKAGLAISFFILENYEMAEATVAQLNPYPYKDLITLITKFKSGVQEGGLSDSISYEIADKFCEEALEIETGEVDRDYWLENNKDLYRSVSIAPEGLPSIANANFKGVKYKNIFDFHSKYVLRKFEKSILDRMTQKDAVEYFIGRMDIYGLNKILYYREYSDVDKPIFLDKLNIVFDKFKERGNTRLVGTNGVCNGCQHGHIGIAFIGNEDDTYIELLIMSENNIVTDIFECNNFTFESYNKEHLGKRLFLNIIEDSEFPFNKKKNTMNIFNLIIGVFVLAKLIGKFLEGYGSNASPMPNQSNNTRRITKPILYNYSNELTIHASLLSYYTKMLNLNNEPEINFDVVNDHYYSKFEEIEDASDLGHRINIDFQELISAREYMCDMCRYYGNRN